MVLSLANNYNGNDLLRYLPLVVASIGHIGLGYFLGHFAGKLMNLSSPDRHFVILMTSFNNNGGLPFILLIPLCSQWNRALEQGHPTDVLAKSYSMITVYGLPWTLMLYTVGKSIIADSGRYSASDEATRNPEGQLVSADITKSGVLASESMLSSGQRPERRPFIAVASQPSLDSLEESTGDDSGDVELHRRSPQSSAFNEDEESTDVEHPTLSSMEFEDFGSSDDKHLKQPLSADGAPSNGTSHGHADGGPLNLPQSPLVVVCNLLRAACKRAAAEPNITSAFTAMLLACSGPIKRLFFSGALSFIGGAVKTVGAPSPVLSTLVLSAGLYNSVYPEKEEHSGSGIPKKNDASTFIPTRFPDDSQMVNAYISSNYQPALGTPEEIDISCSVERSLEDTATKPCNKSLVARLSQPGSVHRLVPIVLFLKLVLMPLVCFPLTWLAIKHGAVDPKDPILQMLLYIEVGKS